MKKLMIVAAVAALTGSVLAGNCKEDPQDVDCATVFTVKFSGKTTVEIDDTYKTVKKVSGKGTLTLADYVTEVLAVKLNGEKYDVVLTDGEVTKFTVFGKKLETVLDENKIKPGKHYTLESDLGVAFEGQDLWDINVNQVAFGKADAYITKETTKKAGACGDDPEVIPGCELVLTPKSYSGWFTGDFQTCLDEFGFVNDCVEFDADGATSLLGGTWSAKYSKKLSK